ncbi:hypothetical protein M1523_00390 [Patescibacteria group bacterium]|nr:hypothetical protein [Patescibacteria group bacterium]MCL5091905.1 hypothetical protein [Patescibacteria group bacterium]
MINSYVEAGKVLSAAMGLGALTGPSVQTQQLLNLLPRPVEAGPNGEVFGANVETAVPFGTKKATVTNVPGGLQANYLYNDAFYVAGADGTPNRLIHTNIKDYDVQYNQEQLRTETMANHYVDDPHDSDFLVFRREGFDLWNVWSTTGHNIATPQMLHLGGNRYLTTSVREYSDSHSRWMVLGQIDYDWVPPTGATAPAANNPAAITEAIKQDIREQVETVNQRRDQGLNGRQVSAADQRSAMVNGLAGLTDDERAAFINGGADTELVDKIADAMSAGITVNQPGGENQPLDTHWLMGERPYMGLGQVTETQSIMMPNDNGLLVFLNRGRCLDQNGVEHPNGFFTSMRREDADGYEKWQLEDNLYLAPEGHVSQEVKAMTLVSNPVSGEAMAGYIVKNADGPATANVTIFQRDYTNNSWRLHDIPLAEGVNADSQIAAAVLPNGESVVTLTAPDGTVDNYFVSSESISSRLMVGSPITMHARDLGLGEAGSVISVKPMTGVDGKLVMQVHGIAVDVNGGEQEKLLTVGVGELPHNRIFVPLTVR